MKVAALYFRRKQMSVSGNQFGNDALCMEDIMASLRDPDLADNDLQRFIYITSKPLGKEGDTGVVQQGDLTSDRYAKIFYFDTQADAIALLRNGDPAPPPEYTPDGDAAPVARSLIREMSAFSEVFVTVADQIQGRNVETIRQVIPGMAIEMFCEHGPHPTCRGVPYTQDDLQPVVSWGALLIVVAAVAFAVWFYLKFIRRRPPPDHPPDLRPFFVEQRHGARKIFANDDLLESDVRSSLKTMR